MNTAVKVSVAERGERSVERTLSGGVKDVSDPSHFPALGSNSTGGGAGPVVRRLSRMSSSFKDTLNSDKPTLSVRTEESAGESTTGNASDLSDSAKGPKMQSLGSPSKSPRIAAERTAQAHARTPSGAFDKQVSSTISPN